MPVSVFGDDAVMLISIFEVNRLGQLFDGEEIWHLGLW